MSEVLKVLFTSSDSYEGLFDLEHGRGTSPCDIVGFGKDKAANSAGSGICCAATGSIKEQHRIPSVVA